MKIAFDVSDLATARADGTTRYTYELARRLPALAPADTWQYYAPFNSQSIARVTRGRANVAKLITPFPKYWTQFRLPFDLYRHRPDVLFMPIQQLPYIRPKGMKTVAVIHDLAFHKYPQQTGHKDWALLHLFTAYAVRYADQLIAVSQSTADDIAYYYGRTANIHVVHHGVDHQQFRLPTPDERVASWEKLQATYPTLRRPYLLFVGQIQPRKNIVRLVEAFEQLRQTHQDMQLVIAGAHGWLQRDILKRIKESHCVEDILLLGRVPDEQLPAIYWHAEAFVLPSLYEGFGMPILEAQACGCPVVTSNTSSLPEVAGDGAVLINPQETDSIHQGILSALRDRVRLGEKAQISSQKFSWETSAQQTMAVLKKLL